MDKANHKLLEDLFKAYYDARKHKRNTHNQLKFELNFESNLFSLYDDIIKREYKLLPSICFIVKKPVKREIFAADFRDRVVHHLIYNYISPIFEKTFINDSYSCRKGKGTHYGIQRIDKFFRSCTKNYTQDAYVLKLDISGYFMSINKDILYLKIEKELMKHIERVNFDMDLILYLIRQTIFNDFTKNCIIKGHKKDWEGLPKTKSMFFAFKNCGLPIGNLTSQLFGNIYLSDFDNYMKTQLRIKYYGRYVDDLVCVHHNIHYLKYLIPTIRQYLQQNLQLVLHPDKVYLQRYTKGVKYLGSIVLPFRIYVSNRTTSNFYQAVMFQTNFIYHHKPLKTEKKEFISSMNSYLGMMKHYQSYKVRRKIICKYLSIWWCNYVNINNNYECFVLK